MDERGWSWPDQHAGRFEISQQAGRYVLVVEGHHIAAGGEAAHGGRNCVIADRDVMHHPCRGAIGRLSEQQHMDPKTSACSAQHPTNSTTAETAHGEEPATPHSRKRTLTAA